MSEQGPDPFLLGTLQRAFRVAFAWCGDESLALAAVEEAAKQQPPGQDSSQQGDKAFWRELRTLCLEKAGGEARLTELAGLAALPEPQRSGFLLVHVAGLSPELAREVTGQADFLIPDDLSPGRIPEVAISTAAATRLEELARQRPDRHDSRSAMSQNPAILAAVAGAVALAGLALWHFTGRAGFFPEEIIQIATLAGKAQAEDFSPLESPLSDIPDWFALQGIESVKVPEALGKMEAVGVRSFRHEGELVAQVAALDGERRFYLMGFSAERFGLHLPASGDWLYKQAGKFALATSLDAGICILVSMPGDVADLRKILGVSNKATNLRHPLPP